VRSARVVSITRKLELLEFATKDLRFFIFSPSV
jgi:hypothetical protein